MRRKLDRESKVLEKALEGNGLTTKRRQGMENNVRGMLAEVDAVEQLPGVVAMGKRFYDCVEAKRRKGGRGRWHAVEVDIVAHEGCTWVEVKSQHTFSISSAQWIGRGKRYKGLKQQAEDLLRLAACPCNLVQWKSPRIAFYFAGGVGSDVAAELRRMGAWVFESTGGGQIDMKNFPPSPERLTSAVLDVTALSALVSELSNGGTSLPEVRNWATRSPWDKCFAQEIASPLLQELDPLLEDRELLTPSSSVYRFEKIVSEIAGPSETNRWIELQRKLRVVDESKLDCSPLDGLDMLQPCQRASLKVAESCASLLLTANRRAVRAASDAGICIPAHQHRPVWLVGV